MCACALCEWVCMWPRTHAHRCSRPLVHRMKNCAIGGQQQRACWCVRACVHVCVQACILRWFVYGKPFISWQPLDSMCIANVFRVFVWHPEWLAQTSVSRRFQLFFFAFLEFRCACVCQRFCARMCACALCEWVCMWPRTHAHRCSRQLVHRIKNCS